MYFDYAVAEFTSIDDAPNPNRYSRMKFGSDEAARLIGYEIADGLFANHSDLLLSNEVVVIPSPYNYVKNAATIVTEHMIDRLNHMLVTANGKHLEYSIVHRKVSYTNDYGFLPKDKREQLLANDKFFINKKFVKGKLILFVDDIKITGTHEEKIKEILHKEQLNNDAIFVYSAIYKGMSPEIEAQLNFYAINSLDEYLQMTMTSNTHLLVRPIKFLLKQSKHEFDFVMQYLPVDFLRKLWYACIGEGYTTIPDYQENILRLKERLGY